MARAVGRHFEVRARSSLPFEIHDDKENLAGINIGDARILPTNRDVPESGRDGLSLGRVSQFLLELARRCQFSFSPW